LRECARCGDMMTGVRFVNKFIIILALAISICAPVPSTTVMYEFKCKSNDANSTMTHDSRLKESELEVNGCALGYKTGSFNYLQKGKIEFEDLIEYHEGHNGSKSDSMVFHNMTVFFEGERGISEFYAGGFFPNNRAICSKKSIRFEEFSRGCSQNSNDDYYILAKNYSSKQIHVNAEVAMGSTRKRNIDYDFAYNATVMNGVIETWDIMGWTNKTGSRRIDWEQSALIKGNITLENNLVVANLFNIHDGQNWLPCR